MVKKLRLVTDAIESPGYSFLLFHHFGTGISVAFFHIYTRSACTAPPPSSSYYTVSSDFRLLAFSFHRDILQAKPYSMDENMFHISYEAGILEDPVSDWHGYE